MPVLFIGHGNPMNAITVNQFSSGWKAVGKSLPVPSAIFCISAHWETNGVYITAMEKPRTIHDFGGFPPELYQVEYPAPGSPELAMMAQQTLMPTEVGLDQRWGLDHGCWSVLRHLVPDANIPVVQMSLDHAKSPSEHFALASELSELRTKGVLIVASGNMVHNLRLLDWEATAGADWALAANEKIKMLIAQGDNRALTHYQTLGPEVQRGIPTPEHYLPMLYALALREEKSKVALFNDAMDLGSLSMTSFRIDNDE